MSETKLPENFWTVEVPIDPFAMAPEVGADLTLIAAHEAELESIVQQMWEDMTTETKILDGTEVPEREEIVIPRISEEEFWALLKTNVSSTEESPSTQ
jgi:hypothetical protein